VFEGEIALVIGEPARHVRPEDGWSHVGWVTAADDLSCSTNATRSAGTGSRYRRPGRS
jgi:5-oxopent-3-ene-1,2,5-tricarboxylate decarboxylase/2-hydroxyhepta-2,4-diene-1,7-dioate isomerase